MNKQKVAVIEDNEINMKLVKTLLNLADFEVVAAEDAETGIDMIREHQPDLILMDIQLPGMDGLEFFRMIDALQQHTLKILISAYGDVELQHESRKIGLDAFMPKPFSVKELINLLVLLLEEYPQKTGENGERGQARATKKTPSPKKEKGKIINEKRRI